MCSEGYASFEKSMQPPSTFDNMCCSLLKFLCPSNGPPLVVSWNCLHSLKLTAFSPLKMDGWKTIVSKVADLSPIHFGKQAATDGTYGSKYW